MQDPKNYNVLGGAASFPKTGDTSRGVTPNYCENSSGFIDRVLTPSGENCFTWARNILLSINDDYIKKTFPLSPFALIASIPSLEFSFQAKKAKINSCIIM